MRNLPEFEVVAASKSVASTLSKSGSSKVITDSEVIFVYQDAGKKAIPTRGPYSELIERFRKGDSFTAKYGSLQFVRFGGKSSDNVLLIGLGSAEELTEEKLRSLGALTWGRLSAEKSRSAEFELESLIEGMGSDEARSIRSIRSFAEGIVLAAYQISTYKQKPQSTQSSKSGKPPEVYAGPKHLRLAIRDKNLKKRVELEIAQVMAVGEAVTLCRDWSNEPSNIGTPEYYAAQAKNLAREYGLKCTVLDEKEALREKMNLFLSVSQGSEREGKIVILEYAPKSVKKDPNQKTIVLVGKGVTFDSGGISIKPAMKMEDMKHDMTGASTVMGAIVVASQWKIQNRVIAIMAFTENMPDGFALQPGNVIASRSGKTVEVLNTDAEGRLILADVLDYAHEFKPDAIVDVATLTGAVSVALGKQCCAIFGNDDRLVSSVRRAGEQNGERIWELPLFDEYFEDLKSDYADMKNVANDSYGGTIRGAIFLKQFIRPGMLWAHLDIAATAWSMGHLPYLPKKGASGFYVRTLAQFAADF